MERTEALNQLREGDHAIFDTYKAGQIARAFLGVTAPPLPIETFKVGEGRVIAGETVEFRGVGAHRLADYICRELGIEPIPAHGIGTRLRNACDKLDAILMPEHEAAV